MRKYLCFFLFLTLLFVLLSCSDDVEMSDNEVKVIMRLSENTKGLTVNLSPQVDHYAYKAVPLFSSPVISGVKEDWICFTGDKVDMGYMTQGKWRISVRGYNDDEVIILNSEKDVYIAYQSGEIKEHVFYMEWGNSSVLGVLSINIDVPKSVGEEMMKLKYRLTTSDTDEEMVFPATDNGEYYNFTSKTELPNGKYVFSFVSGEVGSTVYSNIISYNETKITGDLTCGASENWVCFEARSNCEIGLKLTDVSCERSMKNPRYSEKIMPYHDTSFLLQEDFCFEYSLDGALWSSYVFPERSDTYSTVENIGIAYNGEPKIYYRRYLWEKEGNKISLNAGEKIFFRAGSDEEISPCLYKLVDIGVTSIGLRHFNFQSFSGYEVGYYSSFVGSGDFIVSGDLRCLQDKDFNLSKPVCYKNLFKDFNPDGITDCSSLLIKDISPYSCLSMFEGCSSLTKGPELFLAHLDNNCYKNMFKGCSSLISAPALPAETLKNNCYESMFQNCISLHEAPELLSLNLADDCYKNMFNGCSSLISAPALPAMTLKDNCYNGMFANCSSLMKAEDLPAEKTAANSYSSMFLNCVSLKKSPVILAKEISCANMFKGCSSLNAITVMAQVKNTIGTNWVAEVAGTGTFLCSKNYSPKQMNASGIPENWRVVEIDNYFYIVFPSDENVKECRLISHGADNSLVLEVSKDEKDWYRYDIGQDLRTVLTIEPGDTVYWRNKKNNNKRISVSEQEYYQFVIENKVEIGGNIMSLKNKNCDGLELENFEFYRLFKDTNITSRPVCTAMNSKADSYKEMYDGCLYLDTGAENKPLNFTFPSDEPIGSFMIQGVGSCIGLELEVSKDELYWTDWGLEQELSDVLTVNPGDTVYIRNNKTGFQYLGNAQNNYYNFVIKNKVIVSGNVISLKSKDFDKDLINIDNNIIAYEFNSLFKNTNIKNVDNYFKLSKDDTKVWSDYCYQSMFSGCEYLESVDIVLADELTASCYANMFSGCTSLREAPELPAMTLAGNCYQNMFLNCSSLETVPVLPADKLTASCYASMFSGCTSLREAPELPAMTLAGNCYQNMFLNCSSLETVPVLPADKLTASCYVSMFSGCTSLREAPELPAMTLAGNCYQNMFLNCSSLETAPIIKAEILANYSMATMFKGCTALRTVPELNFTTVGQYSCQNMFEECSSLKDVPALLPSTLAIGCYQYMFLNCSSLEIAPEIFATSVANYSCQGMFRGCAGLIKAPSVLFPEKTANYCYDYMFDGCLLLEEAPEIMVTNITQTYTFSMRCMFKNCSSLRSVKVHFTAWTNNNNRLYQWMIGVSGISAEGVFYCKTDLTENYGTNAIPEGWTTEYFDD